MCPFKQINKQKLVISNHIFQTQHKTEAREPSEISDEEKKQIVHDSVIRRMNPKVLSVIHKTSIDGVRVILNDAGFPDIPKDWEESNYPKVSHCFTE